MASTHRKRTDIFNLRISRLVEKLRAATLDLDERAELVAILQNNTTDSPCMVKAKDDEPIFVLRGQDLASDKCVDHWCELEIEKHLASNDIPLKVADARDCAREMRAYPNRKVAD